MSAPSAIQPVQSSFVAAVCAFVTMMVVLSITFAFFLQIWPPMAWQLWTDTSATFSFTGSSELLRSRGYPQPPGLLGWLSEPLTYLHLLWKLTAGTEPMLFIGIHVAAALFAASVPARIVFRRVRANEPKLMAAEHVSGPQTHWGKAGRARLANVYANDVRQSGAGVELAPGLMLPRKVETEGVLLVGRPGSGKSVILEGVMDQALERGDRVLALDVKGNLAQRIQHFEPRILTLTGPHSSVWSIGRDLLTRDDADEFAAILIPESRDPVWGQGSRLLLAGIIQHLRTKHGSYWGWKELNGILSLPIAALEPLIHKHVPLIAQLLGAREEPANFVLSLILNLAAHVSAPVTRFSALEAKGARGLSLRAWARGTGRKLPPLVLRYDLQRREQSGAFARLVLRVVSGVLLSDEVEDGDDHRVWLFLDEMTRVGRIDPVLDLAALGRSRGVRCVVTVQSPAQLTEIYGPAGAEAVTENFGTQIICQLPQGETARRVAQNWIGDRIVRERPDAVPRDREPQEWTLPALSPADIASEFGLRYDLWGRPLIRAAVLGTGDVAVLDWSLRRWPRLG